MFNKKKTIETATDRRIKENDNQLCNERVYLIQAVENVIITQGAITLYPEGADKQKARMDAEKAKQSLICHIGAYDGLMQEYNERLAKTENRETTKEWKNTHATSHKLVEIAYRNFYKKT